MESKTDDDNQLHKFFFPFMSLGHARPTIDMAILFPSREPPKREESMEAKPPIKVAALCGSLRKRSYNCGLLRSAIELSKESMEGVEIEYIDISPLPMLNTDLEVNGTFPTAVQAFRTKILEADSILFASPEYNYSVTGDSLSLSLSLSLWSYCYYNEIWCLRVPLLLHSKTFFLPPVPAPLKNAIDWGSRPPNVWADKAAAVVTAAYDLSAGGAQYHLRQIGVYIDLHFINKPEIFVNAYQTPAKFDRDGNLIDEAVKEKLKELLLALQAFTLQLKGK
ncbi:hypothetical protein FEM48_Zijuj03G0023400 [Ziziphus jujuba var. spinosa]|uniref:NAD(P)H dehydrogenase (quinone) n=1 Tax=Ziziphus jujuba var. spinosa TaxID=714518 RepID=A0A978VML1_ZIZJJ|nr:hypothetical protein FEM48_Zijuj03G0023400 [Ziziphus jujuba var. spinosa]